MYDQNKVTNTTHLQTSVRELETTISNKKNRRRQNNFSMPVNGHNGKRQDNSNADLTSEGYQSTERYVFPEFSTKKRQALRKVRLELLISDDLNR